MTTTRIKKVSLSVLKRLADEHLEFIGKKKYPYTYKGNKYTQKDIIGMFRRMPMFVMKVGGRYVLNPTYFPKAMVNK